MGTFFKKKFKILKKPKNPGFLGKNPKNPKKNGFFGLFQDLGFFANPAGKAFSANY